MQGSSDENLHKEVEAYGDRVTMIEAVSKVVTDKTGVPVTDAIRFKESRFQKERDKIASFNTALEVFTNGDVLAFIDLIKRMKELFKSGKKWATVSDMIKKLSSSTSTICSTEDNKRHKVSGLFRGEATNVKLLDGLTILGFDMPYLREVINLTDSSSCETVDRYEKEKKKRDTRGNIYYTKEEIEKARKNTVWRQYLTDNKMSLSQLVAELEPVKEIIKFLREAPTRDFVKKWNDRIVPSVSKTLGEVVTALASNEALLADVALADAAITNVIAMYNDESMSNLIASAQTAEIVKLVSSAAQSMPKNPKEKRVTDELERSLKVLVEKAGDVSFARSGGVQEQVRAMRDVYTRMAAIVKLVRGQGSSGQFGTRNWLSSWTSQGSAGIIRPLQPPAFGNVVEVRPNTGRLEMYMTMMEQHLTSIENDPLTRDLTNASNNTKSLINDIVSTMADPACNRPAVRLSVLSAMKDHIKSVQHATGRFSARIKEFMLWSNRKPLQYVMKWYAVKEMEKAEKEERRKRNEKEEGVVQPGDITAIDKYIAAFTKASTAIENALSSVEDITLRLLHEDPHISRVLSEDRAMMEDAQDRVEKLEDFFTQTRAKLLRLYSVEGHGPLDLFQDSTFIIMYVLKAFRVFLIWAALRFARSIFVPFYNDAVYAQNKTPPNPMWFIGIFLGLDLALNIGIYMILSTLQFLFRKDGFPVTARVLRAVLTDYVLSTLLIGLLAIVMASVIKSKKYFRYRFEGDRGIRALSDMVLWTAAAVLCIPYFRFLDM